MTTGLYYHVPFCATTCDFCAFYQKAPDRKVILQYLDTMEREVKLNPPPSGPTTVFWGGGTPGLLMASDLERLGGILLNSVSEKPVEWTIEMAPSTVKKDKIQVLRDLGVTRISVGVQSFQPDLLERMGRQHGVRQIWKAVELLQESGFENVNFDLMFALQGQTIAQWTEDLRTAVSLSPQHISTYCLTFEADTHLWLQLQKGQVSKRSEVEEIAFYDVATDLLTETGFAQYEVSNFARPNRACLHNLDTWNMGEWYGYGPSASSQEGGRRYTNVDSLDDWMRGVSEGNPLRRDVQMLTPQILAGDFLVFGLRMTQGVDLQVFTKRFPSLSPDLFESLWAGLIDEGYLKRTTSDRIFLTREGRLLADRIGVEILSVLDSLV
jgi:oxygen-independent coproporphyrinogen-3 oxidase